MSHNSRRHLLPLLYFTLYFARPQTAVAAPLVDHGDFGEAKHVIVDHAGDKNGQKRLEEVLEELADVAEEEKERVDELEEENGNLKDQLEGMGIHVDETDEGKDGENGQIMPKNEGPIVPDSSEEDQNDDNGQIKPKNEGPLGPRIGRRRGMAEFNIQQTINNNTGTISIKNGFSK